MHDIKFILVYITSGTRQLKEKLDISLGLEMDSG